MPNPNPDPSVCQYPCYCQDVWPSGPSFIITSRNHSRSASFISSDRIIVFLYISHSTLETKNTRHSNWQKPHYYYYFSSLLLRICSIDTVPHR
jgi:hypothetical protein